MMLYERCYIVWHQTMCRLTDVRDVIAELHKQLDAEQEKRKEIERDVLQKWANITAVYFLFHVVMQNRCRVSITIVESKYSFTCMGRTASENPAAMLWVVSIISFELFDNQSDGYCDGKKNVSEWSVYSWYGVGFWIRNKKHRWQKCIFEEFGNSLVIPLERCPG